MRKIEREERERNRERGRERERPTLNFSNNKPCILVGSLYFRVKMQNKCKVTQSVVYVSLSLITFIVDMLNFTPFYCLVSASYLCIVCKRLWNTLSIFSSSDSQFILRRSVVFREEVRERESHWIMLVLVLIVLMYCGCVMFSLSRTGRTI